MANKQAESWELFLVLASVLLSLLFASFSVEKRRWEVAEMAGLGVQAALRSSIILETTCGALLQELEVRIFGFLSANAALCFPFMIGFRRYFWVPMLLFWADSSLQVYFLVPCFFVSLRFRGYWVYGFLLLANFVDLHICFVKLMD